MGPAREGHGSLTGPFGPTPWEDPLSYPGSWPPRSCLLDGDRLAPAPPLDAALDGRLAVLAVGSNGAPAQLHRKLTRAGVPVRVPLLRVTVTDLAPVFCTFAAAYGAVPVTAAARPGARTELVATLLDADQLAAVDATEGGYERPVLDPAVHRVEVGGSGVELSDVSCYVSGTGVLVDPGTGEPVGLRAQRDLWAWLLRSIEGLAEVVGGRSPEAATAALAASRSRRSRFAAALRAAGATAPARPPATLGPGELWRR